MPSERTRSRTSREAQRGGREAAPELEVGRRWPGGEIVAAPRKADDAGEPRVVVRRRPRVALSADGREVEVVCGLPAVTLFTGAGGMDLGLEQAGFAVLCQHERDDACCRTLLANRPGCSADAAIVQGDIRRTPSSLIMREAGLSVVVTGLLIVAVCAFAPRTRRSPSST